MNVPKGFEGLRVVTFEEGSAGEMSRLIQRLDGVAIEAPATESLPAPQSPQAANFAESLLAGTYEVVAFLNGPGTRGLLALLEQYHPRSACQRALAETVTLARSGGAAGALREWRIEPTLRARQPNTWQEVLAALESTGPLAGKRIAVQCCDQPHEQLVEALRERGAEADFIPVHTCKLPEDISPLRQAIDQIIAGQIDAVTFTTAEQVRHVFHVAGLDGKETDLVEALKGTVIGAMGLATCETLRRMGVGVDIEPDRPKMGELVRALARFTARRLRRKRASLAAGVDLNTAPRVDWVWPDDECGNDADPLHDSVFLKACRREPTHYTPVWIMRQAGRYQRAYREIRSRVSFLELCKTPELAAEVTLMAVDQLGVDAAIIFADILLVAEPLGVGLEFQEGRGPVISWPVRTGKNVDDLRDFEPAEALSFVMEAIRLTRRALHPGIPLIGFCGAPFTVASYLIEGHGTRDFRQTKLFMLRDPAAWHVLMDRLVGVHAAYLNAQIDAGVQAVQIFDSWVGCLSETDYREYILPHMKRLIQAVKPGVPLIHYGSNTAALLRQIKEVGSDVIGLDWRVNLAETWVELGYDVAVQGNLDPVVLLSTPAEIRRHAKLILDQVGGRPGHVFNLGHGILPETPVGHAQALVDAVHEYSSNQRRH